MWQDLGLGMPGDVEHAETRPVSQEDLSYLSPADRMQPEVRQQQADRHFMVGRELDRFNRGRGGQDRIPCSLENAADGIADHRIVFDHEDGRACRPAG
jgi:hypothetical protein